MNCCSDELVQLNNNCLKRNTWPRHEEGTKEIVQSKNLELNLYGVSVLHMHISFSWLDK